MPNQNYHLAFRGTVEIDSEKEVNLNTLGASWYVIWVNGEYVTEGPARYEKQFPEYQTNTIKLNSGKNVIAVQVHYQNLDTRILKNISPFLYCSLDEDTREIPISWKVKKLEGYRSNFRRINDQLGWVEWVDTRKWPFEWQESSFDDALWDKPTQIESPAGSFRPLTTAVPKLIKIVPELMAQGVVANTYGYVLDNISARFFLRDLECNELPPQGIWRRYDLGRVRLMRPKFLLDLPAGSVVEFAYSEYLTNGRVAPWITLSASDSYNIDRFIARGGKQEFFPLIPKGGRFVEVHIFADSGKVKFIEETFLERSYFDEADGTFECSDPLLNTIWQTGVETLKACSEDAIIDNPTRERGQWTGDVTTIGLEIGSVAFSDTRLFRRGFVQSAQSARPDGMIAGLCPGGEAYLSSYAIQWVTGCLNYWRVTGDKTILYDLFDAAIKNMESLNNFTSENGLTDKAGWSFIDWGYVRNAGPVDIALNLHYLVALRDMITWSKIVGRQEYLQRFTEEEKHINHLLNTWFRNLTESNSVPWQTIGYHKTVLGLKAGFFKVGTRQEAIRFIKSHILNCFPLNPDAPRLSSPDFSHTQLITPYFMHYVLPLLIENGETEFALEIIRKAWGWALEGGRTTWVEVFDTRWSHCHQWSGSPTWLLSRYFLGLHNRFDIKDNFFDFQLQATGLTHAKGKIPIPNTDKAIHINWEKKGNKTSYELKTDMPVWINIPKGLKSSKRGLVKVKNSLKIEITD
ncbi:MAG: hypothetical protein HC905_08170 [Bacteroidales bacterium]|nr:hypothetical protein [Bacteroidales bacterium]